MYNLNLHCTCAIVHVGPISLGDNDHFIVKRGPWTMNLVLNGDFRDYELI